MSVVKQKSDGKGSLKDIQLLINKYPTILNKAIIQNNKKLAKEEFEWLSPLGKDGFAEYRDDDFIDLLGLKLGVPLVGFWPKSGPQWDALGKSKNGAVFLVEAKANIPEIVSPATQAGQKSRLLINKSLNESKLFLNINNDVDWSGKFYQYTNRLAHLYFLRVINGVDAYLVNIYFLNDKAVKGPKTKEEWEAAIQVMKTYLGVGKHKLSKYMIDVFIDVEDMKDQNSNNMDTILILTIVVIFAIIIISIISIYINRSRNAKKKQITDVTVPQINDIPSLEVIQAPENIDSIIQPIDDDVVEPKDIEPTVKIIRYIKTTGQDEYYREKLLNQNWKVLVEKIKNRDGYQCQHCFGLTLLDSIDEIKNYVDYPEVGEAVINIFKNKELYYKPSSHEYKVLSCQSYGNFTFTRLEDTDLFTSSGKIDLVSTSPLNEENIYGISKFIDIDSSFRYNLREPAKTTKSIGIIYFVDGNTNNQLVLRNIEWYKPGLPYAKQGILTFNGLSIVFPLLSIKKEYLDVHHKAYYEGLEPWECPDNELITLCHRCHMKAHEQEIPVKRIIN